MKKNTRLFLLLPPCALALGITLPLTSCLTRDFKTEDVAETQPAAYGMGPSDLYGNFVVFHSPALTETGLAQYIERRAADFWKGRANYTTTKSGALVGWPPSQINHTLLAKAILATARNFQIDPYVFAGLISKESSFTERARSNTHAIGLTQFTQVAVQEMQIQLGAVKAAISAKQVDALKDMSEKALGALNAIDPKAPLGLDAFIASLGRYNGGPASRFRYLEEVLLKSYKAQLVLGAAYLRILYGSAKVNKNGFDGIDTAEGYYRRALFSYNGDPNVQRQYQRDIMDSHVRNIKAAQSAVK